MLNALKKSAETRRNAQRLYARIVERARAPYFFDTLQVADTINGRFDMLALHAWLVLEALQKQGQTTLAQQLTNMLFAGFEDSLREQGAGDIGMSRRMSKMGAAYYGRLQAYGEAKTEAALTGAIMRNVYRGDVRYADASHALAKYAALARAKLATANIAANEFDFDPLPEFDHGR